MNDKEQNKVIKSAVELWEEFSKSAAFHDTDYDSALFEDIKSYLGIDKKADFLKELKSISVEELLNALFTNIKPFSEMLNDLLEVFSKAGAKYTDKNLKIAVDFGELKVDLENFRTDVETISEVIRKSVKTYFITDPWGLRKLFEFEANSCRAMNAAKVSNNEIRDWAVTYINDKLPTYFPDQPKFNEEIDSRIGVIWNDLHEKYRTIKSVYKKEAGIQESIEKQLKCLWQLADEAPCGQNKQTLLAKGKMFVNEHDRYTCTMMVTITMFVEHLYASDEDERDLLIEKFKANFDSVFKGFKSVTHEEVVEKIKQINSFLNLPYWQHRYEIYSAWVFTLIVKAFEYSNLKYELTNGDTLSFSFGGSHLATYNQDKPLEIWAECRSATIAGVKGKGRISGIQPDYTIAYNEAKTPCNAVAVVGCKQYKKSNTGNFSKAIIDYANNRPNAKIFLVNYGTVGDAVNKKVMDEGIDESRFATFGGVRPQNSDGFVKALKSYLYEPLTITLCWGECPVDLDLILDITSQNVADSHEISYKNMGAGTSFPYAVLNHDCTNGCGPEIITVLRVESGKKYSVKVDNFSGEDEVSGEITLKVECNAFKKEYSRNEIFKLWNVCTVENGKFVSIDTIEKLP